MAPVNPVTPVPPVDPVAPVFPVTPVTPVVPVDPVSPVTPVGPITPVGPVAPVASIIHNTTEVMDADKGVIVLLNMEQDVASFGVSPSGVTQLLRGLEDGPLR